MLHAGLPPQWDFDLTRQMAQETEQAIQGPGYERFFKSMYGNKPVSGVMECLNQIGCVLQSTVLLAYVTVQRMGYWIFHKKARRGRNPSICCLGLPYLTVKAWTCGLFLGIGRRWVFMKTTIAFQLIPVVCGAAINGIKAG